MNGECDKHKEVDEIRSRYSRRKVSFKGSDYGLLRPCTYMWEQEKERALIKLFKRVGIQNLHDKRVLEIGCGTGNNLLQLMRMGFQPENMEGNDLLDDRVNVARRRLPASVMLVAGDASEIGYSNAEFDVVFQSTVFSSILDENFRAMLAKTMWNHVRPGGGVLWYDFIYNNPKNPDVRGVPVRRIRDLFPQGEISVRSITLAPPICRLVTKVHPALYTVFNALPFLRSHVLCWIKKPSEI